MPSFRYRAYGDLGDLVEGQIDAASVEAVEATLWAQGLTLFKLDDLLTAKQPWWKRELFQASAVSRVSLVSFTRELSELYASGVPLDDCMRILSDEATDKGMRRTSALLHARIIDGSTLADAMQSQPLVFSAEYLNVVRAGEVSGTLEQAFGDLADLMERRASVDARVRSALIYPVVLLGMAVVSIGIVVGVLVPSIAPIFAESGKQVPGALQLLISLRENWVPIISICVGLVVSVFGSLAFIRRSPARYLAYDRFKLRLPAIGAFVLHKEVARFVRTLGTLLKAGVPLLQASMSAQEVVRNRMISSRIERAVGMVREGSSLSSALRQEDAFPPVIIRMISVGEETAKLDRMLLRAAAMFEDRTQRSIENLMSLLTPALTLLISGIVGGLLLTVMSAILSINDLAAG